MEKTYTLNLSSKISTVSTVVCTCGNIYFVTSTNWSSASNIVLGVRCVTGAQTMTVKVNYIVVGSK